MPNRSKIFSWKFRTAPNRRQRRQRRHRFCDWQSEDEGRGAQALVDGIKVVDRLLGNNLFLGGTPGRQMGLMRALAWSARASSVQSTPVTLEEPTAGESF